MEPIKLTVGESAMLRILAARYDAGHEFSLTEERDAGHEGPIGGMGIFRRYTDEQLDTYGGMLADKGLIARDGDRAHVTELGVACFEAVAGVSADTMRRSARQGVARHAQGK